MGSKLVQVSHPWREEGLAFDNGSMHLSSQNAKYQKTEGKIQWNNVRIQKSCWAIYTIWFSTPTPKRTVLCLATLQWQQQTYAHHMQILCHGDGYEFRLDFNFHPDFVSAYYSTQAATTECHAEMIPQLNPQPLHESTNKYQCKTSPPPLFLSTPPTKKRHMLACFTMALHIDKWMINNKWMILTPHDWTCSHRQFFFDKWGEQCSHGAWKK